MQLSILRSTALAVVFGFVSLALLSCGGGGSGDSTADAGVGSVAFLLTDGPAEDFDEMNMTVVRAELLGDHGRVTVFEGNRTFNLLDLKDARVFAIRRDVPAGTYNKIRLTLSRMELVKKDQFGNIVETYRPKLPGNGKLDLVPRGDFIVTAGRTLVVQLDADGGKSIHIVGTGSNKYQLRPVVFVDVVSGVFPGKFVQLHGVVENIDSAEQAFDLCQTNIPVRVSNSRDDDSSRGCIEVAVSGDTSIFDEGGMPAGFGSLVEGDEATVFGRFRRDDDEDDDTDGHRELDDLELAASVIELGPESTFQALDGVARSDTDADDQFSFEIDANQGFVAGTEVTVQLHSGTAIINRYGDVLDRNAIAAGVPMTVRGVLDLSTVPDTLNTSLIIVDTDAGSVDRISGTVGGNPDGVCGLALNTADGAISVRTGPATEAFLVTSSNSVAGSEQIDVQDLASGLSADVYGTQAGDGCFDARTIIGFVTPG